MYVQVKVLDENAVIPYYAHDYEDMAFDFTATACEYDIQLDCYVYHTGLAFEIPKGYGMLIFPRSSNRKTNAYMPDSVGIIDSGYRGEVLITFKNRDGGTGQRPPYGVGERIAQGIVFPYQHVSFNRRRFLSKSERGKGGHGSTGE